jgi:hypothetical protein
MQPVTEKLGTRTTLVAILALGMLARVIFALGSKGHWYDLDLLGDWGWNLRFHRTDEFYSFAKKPDHLPGDLWFHWFLSTWFSSFGGTHYWGETYYFLLKMLPSAADVVIAILLFDIVRNLVSARAGLLASVLFFLNPAVFFVSSVWGQWDSVSMALLMAGLAIVVGRPDRWILAVPLIAWATVVKPPLALPGIFILVFPMLLTLRDNQSIPAAMRRIVPASVACGALGIATIVAVCAPFNVGLPGMSTNWTIFERAQIALDLYPYKVLSAGNIWMLQQGSFAFVDDRSNAVLGINAHDLGNIYLAVSVIVIAAIFVYLVYTKLRDRPHIPLMWALVAVTYATFMVPTRVHERYLFPALVLGIVLLAITRAGPIELLVLGVVSATFLANLWFVYFDFHEGFRVDYGDGAFAFLLRTTSVLNVFAFIAILLMPLRWIDRPTLHRNNTRTVRAGRDSPARQVRTPTHDRTFGEAEVR